MFDLKMRAGDDLASVPVPLPGRVMLFAGPGGAPMVRDAGGAVRAFVGATGAAGTVGATGAPGASTGLGLKKIYKNAARTVVANTSEQILLDLALAANTFAVGDVIEAVVSAAYNGTGVGTFSVSWPGAGGGMGGLELSQDIFEITLRGQYVSTANGQFRGVVQYTDNTGRVSSRALVLAMNAAAMGNLRLGITFNVAPSYFQALASVVRVW